MPVNIISVDDYTCKKIINDTVIHVDDFEFSYLKIFWLPPLKSVQKYTSIRISNMYIYYKTQSSAHIPWLDFVFHIRKSSI